MAFFPVAILRRHPGLNGKLFAGKRYNGKISTAFWIQSLADPPLPHLTRTYYTDGPLLGPTF